ncbi:cytochrome b [Bosea vaviloviae]|uniref:Cytochrome b561 bacterial/Ni-hydrogenase domain-containing protein n=1 Tax=Bosea vaviloviae TaxID=1526658 RepID=A0A1D7U4E5_9HYPH|nr:cytochrome b/b6 domain-containing protein [Bosea vaviloviae]AOO82245.1 hypothetical protein BHK69_18960 [Bosea vaviloviae]
MNDNLDVKYRWSLVVRLLHWLTASLAVIQVALAFTVLSGPGMTTVRWLPVHMSLGSAILAIVLIRISWRAFENAPVRPLAPTVRMIGSVVHACLYLLILTVAVTGWLAYRPSPLMRPVLLFGSIPMPIAPRYPPISPRSFALVHYSLVWIFLGLVVVHVGAVLVHALVFRDGVLQGMLFGREIAQRNILEQRKPRSDAPGVGEGGP